MPSVVLVPSKCTGLIGLSSHEYPHFKNRSKRGRRPPPFIGSPLEGADGSSPAHPNHQDSSPTQVPGATEGSVGLVHNAGVIELCKGRGFARPGGGSRSGQGPITARVIGPRCKMDDHGAIDETPCHGWPSCPAAKPCPVPKGDRLPPELGSGVSQSSKKPGRSSWVGGGD
jgi:hypothetical protein